MKLKYVCLMALAIQLALGCQGRLGGPEDRASGDEVLLGLSISDGEVSEVEILGQFEGGVLRSLGRPLQAGALRVTMLDATRQTISDGYLPDPRNAFVDEFVGDELQGGTVTATEAASFVIVPAPPDLVGSVEFTLSSLDGEQVTSEFAIDLTDGSATRVGVAKDAHLVHLLGPRNPDDAVIIVLIPNGFGDDQMATFETFARDVATATAGADWFMYHRHQLSFWAMSESVVDSLDPPDCSMDWDPIGAGRLWTRGYLEAALRRYGDVVASPDIVVVVTNEECRAFALFGTVLMDNVDERDTVLAHELGHALGLLMDEYVVTPCLDVYANAVPEDSTRWQCIEAGAPYETTCSDGSPVSRTHAIPSSCAGTWTSACSSCMMRDAVSDFCPVCSAFMDANLARVLGSRVGETCNGVDDDLNLAVDEDCSCEHDPCTPETEVCDGADNDCDGEIDEGCGCTNGETRACGSDVGACSPGIESCSAGAWGPCEGSVGPTTETCDGVDNDCNGSVDEGSVCGGVCAGPGSTDVAYTVVSGAGYVYSLAGGTGSWTYNEISSPDVTVLRWQASAPAGCAITSVAFDLPLSLPDDADRGCATPGTCATRRTSSARYQVTSDSSSGTEVVDQAAAGSTATVSVAPSASVSVSLGDVTGDSRRGEAYIVFHNATFHWE